MEVCHHTYVALHDSIKSFLVHSLPQTADSECTARKQQGPSTSTPKIAYSSCNWNKGLTLILYDYIW